MSRFDMRGGLTAGLARTAIALTVFLAPAFAMAQVDAGPLDSAERRSLAEGRLVVRSATQSRGSLSLVGGVSYQVIDVSPDDVWEALGDTQKWGRMLPQVAESRQVASNGAERTVYLRQAQGPFSASYYLRVTYGSTRDLTFALDTDRPHDIHAAWGFMSVRPYGDGQTLVSYGAMVDIGDGLLSTMVRGTMHEWLLRVPSTIKAYVERHYETVYAAR
jgi:carbon monoxide dehydrogenase subunit G